MAESKKSIETKEEKTGKKRIVVLDPEGTLERTFQDLIAKGAKIDLKDASEFESYTELAMYIKDCLKKGKFTKLELLHALCGSEDDADYDYEDYKENYPDTDDSFVNYLQDYHDVYSSVLVCETEDEIYLVPIEECDAEKFYCSVLKELALAVSHIHIAKEPSKEVLNIVNNFTTTDKTVNLNNVLNDVFNDQPTPEAGVKVLSAPMFMKL